MSDDGSGSGAYPLGPQPTIGVFGNRQIYEGTTIATYERTLLQGIRAAAQAHGCNLLLACGVGPHTAPFEWLPAWPKLLPSTNFVPVGPWNTSGLIAIPPFTATQHALLRSFMPEGFPLVFTSPQPGYASIGPDNALGIAQAFAHLVGHGHRRIAFIAADAHPEGDGAERLAAYQQALADHGIPFDPRLVGYGGHNQHDSYDAVRQIIAEGTPFTAVLASNDESAAGALGALRDAGLRAPEDVAVIGFDDVQHAKAQVPPLTTVRHPTFELGERAVELLLERIRAPQAPPSIVRIPTQLIIRESCGCQPAGAQPWPAERPAQRAALAEALAEAVRLAAPAYERALLGPQCDALAAGWLSACAEGDARPFAAALDAILLRLERVDDIHGWQVALGALSGAAPQQPQLAAHMLDLARARVGDYLHRQHTRSVIRDAQHTEQLGLITAQLLTAIEPQQILDILDAHLPTLGIGQISIALFAASEGDPVAWSDLYVRASGALSMRRFASRSFPPQGMYNPERPFHLALLPLVIEDGPSGFVVFDAADLEICGLIVRHIAAAFRNSRLHADALLGRQLAEEASRMKSRFLSTVSHELRTPLNLIVGLSELLLHAQPGLDALPDMARQDLERIFANAQHLGRLIGDVLDLASSEAGQLRLYQEHLDLVEVLDVVAATGQQMAGEKGLMWQISLPEGPVAVRGDRTRLRQVALNFISNAVKFTEQGGVALRLSVEREMAIVAVSDSGPGVPLADQRHIFDEFRASERTADRGYGGLGLGLSICKQLIERHGGTIGVQSSGEEESGAIFFFSLPLLAETKAEQSQPTAQQLVVCLSERDREDVDLAALLGGQERAVQVQWVDVASDWLPRLIAQPPSALVLDEPLASSRGWEIMAVLKRHPATSATPVLMYAFDAHTGRGTLLELDYLLKPLNAELLARALRQQGADEGASKSILVVDDDGDTRALHARLVQQQLPDHRVIEASNGREALAILRHITPSLVLLDLLMPELDGFGVIEAMRASEATRDVPVVVLTAQILTREDMARLNAGVASILSKGLFSLDEIQGHVESALSRQRRLSGIMQQVVRQAVAFIHSHYDQPITRDQLAAEVGVSGDHLTASFRQEMGITPIAYLNRYRVSRARHLLETTSRSVTDIALAVGCPDLPNFSRLFHREVGMPPNAYRRAKQP